MDDVLVIGAGPAGLLAAWVARRTHARVRLLATGIGTTHVSPGWLGILDTDSGPQAGDLQPALDEWILRHPAHPYALAGSEALRGGIAALREVCSAADINYLGDLQSNFRLPTALGAVKQAALVPETFASGDLRQPGEILIAGPAGWRDFYPVLCAENLARQGFSARAISFDLPEMHTGQFDPTPAGLARLFDQPGIREQVAALIRPRLAGANRVGLAAILGLEHCTEAWHDLQDRLGVPVFEIPTLPPSVPGIRLYNAFKAALGQAGVQILLDMEVTHGLVQDHRAHGVAVPGSVREMMFSAERTLLATGGLYGGGIVSDYQGCLRETVFGLPVMAPDNMSEWFDDRFIGGADHAIHRAGLRANQALQPVDAAGQVLLENVRIVGRLLGGYSPLSEGSTEGAWLATAYRAAS
jgi:glycerol-3-phosphate dehydrogenase subunit B